MCAVKLGTETFKKSKKSEMVIMQKLPKFIEDELRKNVVKDVVGIIGNYCSFDFQNTEAYNLYKNNKDKKGIKISKYSYEYIENQHLALAFQKNIYNIENIAEIAVKLKNVTYKFKKLSKVDNIFLLSYLKNEYIKLNNLNLTDLELLYDISLDDVLRCSILLRIASFTVFVPYNIYDILCKYIYIHLCNAKKIPCEYTQEYLPKDYLKVLKPFLNVGLYNLHNIVKDHCNFDFIKLIKNDKHIAHMKIIMEKYKINTIENVIKQYNYPIIKNGPFIKNHMNLKMWIDKFLSLEPRIGQSHRVAWFDYTSLYPSIIMSPNISYSSLIPPDSKIENTPSENTSFDDTF